MSAAGAGERTTVRACALADLPPGACRRVNVDPPIAVFNVGDGIYATDDTCSHAKASLADGYLDEDVVECPFHGAQFCVRTGEPLSPPAVRALRTYPVSVTDDGDVLVDLSG